MRLFVAASTEGCAELRGVDAQVADCTIVLFRIGALKTAVRGKCGVIPISFTYEDVPVFDYL